MSEKEIINNEILKITKNNVDSVINEALSCAKDAAMKYMESVENSEVVLGNSWSFIRPAKSILARRLAERGIGCRCQSTAGRYNVWNPAGQYNPEPDVELTGYFSQKNVDAQRAGCLAFNKVLRKYGVKTSLLTRLE